MKPYASAPLQRCSHLLSVLMSCSGESEFAQLSSKEQELLRAATIEPAIGQPMKAPRVADFDQEILQQLHNKGLIWMEVPVEPDDRFVIPPLEVSPRSH